MRTPDRTNRQSREQQSGPNMVHLLLAVGLICALVAAIGAVLRSADLDRRSQRLEDAAAALAARESQIDAQADNARLKLLLIDESVAQAKRDAADVERAARIAHAAPFITRWAIQEGWARPDQTVRVLDAAAYNESQLAYQCITLDGDRIVASFTAFGSRSGVIDGLTDESLWWWKKPRPPKGIALDYMYRWASERGIEGAYSVLDMPIFRPGTEDRNGGDLQAIIQDDLSPDLYRLTVRRGSPMVERIR